METEALTRNAGCMEKSTVTRVADDFAGRTGVDAGKQEEGIEKARKAMLCY